MVQGLVRQSLVGGRRAIAAVFFMAGFSGLAPVIGSVQAADVFTVENVTVDATAESAAAARERAIDQRSADRAQPVVRSHGAA